MHSLFRRERLYRAPVVTITLGVLAGSLITTSAHAQHDFPTETRYYEDIAPPRTSGRLPIQDCRRIRPTGANRTLGEAARNLARVLNNAGHTEVGWFLTHPPLPPSKILPDSNQINGFALVTRLQEKKRIGGPIVIITGGLPRRDRLFAFFVVTGAFGRQLSNTMSYSEARNWIREGAPSPFTRLDSMPWTNQACYALVYMYERSGQNGSFVPVDEVDVRAELKEAGIWQALGLN
jgi:hypothetical protein